MKLRLKLLTYTVKITCFCVPVEEKPSEAEGFHDKVQTIFGKMNKNYENGLILYRLAILMQELVPTWSLSAWDEREDKLRITTKWN
jgi:hypothetical protein